jgi:hypothetical protein
MSRSAGVKPRKSKFPMTVKTFFAEADFHLRHGDILLSRSPTFTSQIIRFVSGQFFSHAAVVFLLPQKLEHFTHTFVIESLFRGVGIANLESYTSWRNPVEEVGVLRLQGREFTKDFFRRANGTLLNEINKPYDFRRLWHLAWTSVFKPKSGGSQVHPKHRRFRRWYPRQFICSGFIQFGYHQAAVDEKIDTRDIILTNGLANPSMDDLMGTTPEDLAKSDKLTWKYVIRRGWVYEVARFDEAKRIISGGRL